MNFKNQFEAMCQLTQLAQYDRQSVLIEGPQGCGKSYLARSYADLLNIADFQCIVPKVDQIKSTVEGCLGIENKIVICIENLDVGVPAASYALLKFLEEPLPNVYIVVTCRNIKFIPDTIVSRSAVVSVSPAIRSDLNMFAESKDLVRYYKLRNTVLWTCAKSFTDAELILRLSDAQLNYFASLTDTCKLNDCVSNIVWKLGHYDDNTETPIEIVIRYMARVLTTPFVQKCSIECLDDLSQGRIASHAVLSKFVFNIKYCE